MSPEMDTVVWIVWVGALLLFAALAGLVGLMYLLTSPLLFAPSTRPAARGSTDGPAGVLHEMEEIERRRRAAAAVVAVACAEADRSLPVSLEEPSGWRLLNRSVRLQQRVTKRAPAR